MQNYQELMRDIESRMQSLGSTDVCALFLLCVETREPGRALDLGGQADRAASLLSRFFRITDIVGYLGGNRFAAFLTGHLTGSVIWEKAATLSEALWFATEQVPAESIESYVGVYMFRAYDDVFEAIFRKADYALEMAHNDANRRFYIYTMPGTEPAFFRAAPESFSSHMLRSYIDEGVRLIEVGERQKAVYISPGYYRRLSLAGDAAAPRQIRIHPADEEAYERDVAEAAATGRPVESRYRVSRDGASWVPCRLRLLRISEDEKGAVVLEISHNISGLEELKSQYDEKREWLRFLAAETDYQLWEVDVRARTFRLLYTKNLLDGRQTIHANFPESLIENGRVHRDSAARFRAFAEGMFSGKGEGSGNFIVQYRQTSCYGWASMSYHMLYDDEGHPQKAIGIKEDLSYMPVQQRGMQRRIMPADLYPHLYCYLQANLTADTVEKLQLEGRERIELARFKTYTQVSLNGINRLFSAEDGERFTQKFGRERLLEEFARGRRWFYELGQVVDLEGAIQWISVGVNLCPDPETGDVCLFAYMSVRNRQHEWETAVQPTAEFDLETGAYLPDSARRMVDTALKLGGQAMCALAVIHVGGISELMGGGDGNRQKQDILIALNVALDTDSILWRKDDDTLCAFFPNAGSRTLLKRRLESAFSFTRTSMAGVKEMKLLRFVAGAVCVSTEKAGFARMQQVASRVCAVHEGEPADAVLLSEEEYRWDDVELGVLQPGVLASQTLEPTRLMTEEDKDVALDCLRIMLRSETQDASVNAVLERLGQYYHADRAYILVLGEQGQVVTMLNEWVKHDKHSIQQSISGKRVSGFPVIARYAATTVPVVLSMRQPPDEKSAGGEVSWQYAIFPMEKLDGASQLLCIENPRRPIERTALLTELSPYLSRERTRRANAREALSPLDRLYALPNQQAYMDAAYAMDSDRYRSLGALAVDIPDFARLKEVRGYEYGMRFLLRISEVLMDVFGRSLLFHTREAEFVVLCADTTYEVFLNQCARAKQLVGRKYMGLFRLGCTWSDGIFRAPDLVAKARSIMKCAMPTDVLPAAELAGNDEWGALLPRDGAGRETGKGGQFAIYLQPKVDMRTGQLIGAEALARVLDKQGNLLPHGRVIEDMEKNGTISRLDYFVFDRVLSTLSRWKGQGYPLRAISSNFSRKTLLNPTALASVLAILSRYPDVTQSLVELEITETGGGFENNTFSELIGRFAGYGLQFSLDDFGSSYSNLSMLADLSFHSVKLDRSMVRSIATNSVSQMMVRDIAKICASRGMLLIAEGVETRAQADALTRDGCFYAQGYYYGRPMPVEAFEKKYFAG